MQRYTACMPSFNTTPVRFNFLFLLLSVSLFTVRANAQDNRPYTRYGLGELQPQMPSGLRAWGFQSAADQDPYRFNPVNPASLGSLASSVLQLGVFGNATWLKANDSIDRFGSGSVDYVMLGVPVIRNKWGMAAGLLPYARTNYSVIQLNEETTGIPRSVNRSSGRGALYEAYLATGWQFGGFSFGVKGAYAFGNMDQTSVLVFDDTLNGFNSRFNAERAFSGFTWNGGVQYQLPLATRDRIQFGASARLSQTITARRNFVYERFLYNANNAEVPFDTIDIGQGERGDVTLPAQYDAGIIFKRFATDKRDVVRWQAGLNFTYTAHEDYRSFGESDSLHSTFRLAGGVEWTPRDEAIEGYHNRVRYRAGSYYGTGALQLRNQAFNRYGVTFGLGLPVRRVFSYIDVSVDYGVHGPSDKTLLREQYLNGTVGFSFSDRWFIKRRYD